MTASITIGTIKRIFSGEYAVIAIFAAVKLSIHLLVNLSGGYGYIRDELYYLACSDHMAWGYVDHPPLSIALLWLSRAIFGDSLFALRLLPALSGAAAVVLTGLIVKRIGGGTYAQAIACCCAISAPLLLGVDSIFSMNSFEILLWTLAFYLIILCLQKRETKFWVYLGVTLGLGLLNKISVLWLGCGIAVGLMLTPDRKLLLARGPWIAASIALLLFLPHILWQTATGYPTVEFIRNASSGKYFALTPLDLFLQQSLFMNPLTLPIWLSGAVYFLIKKEAKAFRILPLVYIVVFVILAVNRNSKAAYFAPLLPMLFALGAVAVEKVIATRRSRLLRILPVVLVAAGGVVLAPFVLAVLPVDTYISYAATLGVAPASSETNKLGNLPQHFADMFGWPEMAAVVADAYNALTPEEKKKCIVLCNNYGEAGAIDFFGRRYGLPRAVSGHNNYWLWGAGTMAGEVVILLGGSSRELLGSYGEVMPAGVIRSNYAMPYERDLPVWICRNRRVPLAEDWGRFKVFN